MPCRNTVRGSFWRSPGVASWSRLIGFCKARGRLVSLKPFGLAWLSADTGTQGGDAAESDNRPDLGVRSSHPDHFHAVDQRKLHRRAADPTRCSMDNDAFCRGSACRRVEQVIGDLIVR